VSHQRAAQIANDDRHVADRHRRKAIAELQASYEVVPEGRATAARRKR
jgi:hypothetical protein